MLTNLELYGRDDVPPVPKNIADERIEMLRENLKIQLEMPLKKQSSYLQTRILEGIKFWQKLSNQEDAGI